MGSGRVNRPEDAQELALRFAAEGMECATVHVGWGLEDDQQAFSLLEAVLDASTRHGVPLYVETHRATILQDMWRTVQFVKRFPEIRFNGDFSHWYTGLEMVYGGFQNKFEFIRPVLERVSFLHGRIGDPGSMQVEHWVRQCGDSSVHRALSRPVVRLVRGISEACATGRLHSFRARVVEPANLLCQAPGGERIRADRRVRPLGAGAGSSADRRGVF